MPVKDAQVTGIIIWYHKNGTSFRSVAPITCYILIPETSIRIWFLVPFLDRLSWALGQCNMVLTWLDEVSYSTVNDVDICCVYSSEIKSCRPGFQQVYDKI